MKRTKKKAEKPDGARIDRFLQALDDELAAGPNAALLITAGELLTRINRQLGHLLAVFPEKPGGKRGPRKKVDREDQFRLALKLLAAQGNPAIRETCRNVIARPYWSDGYDDAATLAVYCANRGFRANRP